MIIKKEHFDKEKTQKWFYFFVLINGYKVGDVIPNYAYQLWNTKQWLDFKKQNGYSEDCILYYIENWHERFTLFLQAQLPNGTVGEMIGGD